MTRNIIFCFWRILSLFFWEKKKNR